MKRILPLLLCLACDQVRLIEAPLVIDEDMTERQQGVVREAVAEWVHATGGAFCPAPDCEPTVGDVQAEDPWSIVEVGSYWPRLGPDHDAGGVHELWRDEGGTVLYDAIVLVRHHWTRRTVLHELGHRAGLEDDVSPLMMPSGPLSTACIGEEELRLFCQLWICGDTHPTCERDEDERTAD